MSQIALGRLPSTRPGKMDGILLLVSPFGTATKWTLTSARKLTRDPHPGQVYPCKSPSIFNNASPSSGVRPEWLLFLWIAFQAAVTSPLRRSILCSIHDLHTMRLLEPSVHSCPSCIRVIAPCLPVTFDFSRVSIIPGRRLRVNIFCTLLRYLFKELEHLSCMELRFFNFFYYPPLDLYPLYRLVLRHVDQDFGSSELETATHATWSGQYDGKPADNAKKRRYLDESGHFHHIIYITLGIPHRMGSHNLPLWEQAG